MDKFSRISRILMISAKINPREITKIVKKRTKTKEFGLNCTYTAKLNPRENIEKPFIREIKSARKNQNPTSAKINPREN